MLDALESEAGVVGRCMPSHTYPLLVIARAAVVVMMLISCDPRSLYILRFSEASGGSNVHEREGRTGSYALLCVRLRENWAGLPRFGFSSIAELHVTVFRNVSLLRAPMATDTERLAACKIS
jgi:hypothetical protein